MNALNECCKDLLLRVDRGLVRVEDIVTGQPVYGGVSDSDRTIFIKLVEQAQTLQVSDEDIFSSLRSLTSLALMEMIPPAPMTTSTTPTSTIATPIAKAQGQQTVRPVSAVEPAANIALKIKSMNPQELQQQVDKALKNPQVSTTLNKTFAEIFTQLLQGK